MAAEARAAPAARHPGPARDRETRRGLSLRLVDLLVARGRDCDHGADRRFGQAASDLAEFVAALQRIDATDGPRPGAHNSFRGVPLATRDEPTRAAIAPWATRSTGGGTAAWEAALGAPEWHRAPVWIHGDLDPRNVLVAHGRLSAVIDFGCLGVGDPACDVMVAWKLFTAHTRDVFRAALAVDDATWARARGWALSQALIALGYYTLETNRVLVLEARRWLVEVLADRRLTARIIPPE